MKTILITNVLLYKERKDVLIRGNMIHSVEPAGTIPVQEYDKIIDGSRKAIIPGFVNAHAHSAMTLFRGVGEDVPLDQWLKERIWPYEAKLDEEMVYWGAKLACVEMIRTGTTTFNDMYWHLNGTLRAAEEMGMRSVQSFTWLDNFNDEIIEQNKKQMKEAHKLSARWSPLTTFAISPHAIYTVSEKSFRYINNFAKDNGIIVHTHLAETRSEMDQAERDFGMSPTEYLNKLGLLSPSLIAAHSLWLSSDDIKLLGDNGVNTVHNPNSNLKLASGYKFKYNELRDAGANVCLGTDGCASSNNLDMIDSMKAAALLQKVWRNDPGAIPLKELMDVASLNGAKALRINTGKIAPGYLADIALVDMAKPSFVPNHYFLANLVYAANGECIDTVICDGKIIMENQIIPGQDKIYQKVQEVADRVVDYKKKKKK
ncbi:MAG: amidohydrolase [Bacteroidales bacterium]|jgi:5-methylthioadenosine/S-adenosylhomocysteine deaminase|nr:amidohydrolase [Bacteroidales bacterium]MDD4481220.1 amidohydrolase [Bacteroidales bacterium]MDD5713720.1 amidohydrolase [Bacteroidales bacterium]MDY0359763.1 amidohydrolase [Bacteroidales bacterium]